MSPPRPIAAPGAPGDSPESLTREAAVARLAELARERRVADALIQVAEQAGETLDLQDVLSRISRLTVELMPCDRCTIYLYSTRRKAYIPAAQYGTPPAVIQRFTEHYFYNAKRSGGGRAKVPFEDELRAERTVVMSQDDEGLSPEYLALLKDSEQYSMCLVPVGLPGSSRGTLAFGLAQPPGFDETAIKIAQGVARQAAALIQNARLFEDVRRAARIRAGLAGLAAAVNLETDPEKIARLVSEAAALFGVNAGAVLVSEREGLLVLGAHGLPGEGMHLSLGEDTAMLVQAFRDGATVFENQLKGSPMGTGPLVSEFGLRSALALPLVGREGTLGCLLLGDTQRAHRFTREIANEILVLGPITSAALERAALSQQVERSEEHFRSLIENASDSIAIVGADGVFQYQSPTSERIVGYKAEELVGRQIGEFLHPDEASRIGQLFTDLVTGSATRAEHEGRFRHKDGSWRVLEGVGTRLLDARGTPTLVLNTRDVTERKRAEAREAGQKRVLELLARGDDLGDVLGALVATIEADLPGVMVAVLLVGDQHATLRPVAAPHVPDALRKRLEGLPIGRNVSCAGSAACRGERVVISDVEDDPLGAEHAVVLGVAGVRACWAQPVLSASGDVLGVLVLYRPQPHTPDAEEMSLVEAAAHLAGIAIERKQAERALAAARDEALAAARLKSEFLANMSHEIRTPMTGVIGMADILADTSLTADQRDFVNTIRTSAEALLTVINDILDFSKIEAGKITIEHVDFDLRTVMEEIGDLLAPRVFKKGLEFACRVPPRMPEYLVGDPGRLRQVLTNLLGNAIKFTETGTVSMEAEVVGETETHVRLRLSVRDTGIGIPEDRHQVIFESFTQADGSTTRRYGGTGLGLTISRQLVELMGGRIGLDSAADKGSTFWIELPFVKQKKTPTERTLPADIVGIRVLVVDDHEVNRRILLEQLASWGCRPEAVAGGREAIARLVNAHVESTPFHLVVLDMQMPEMDGEDTARAIQADPRIAHLPIVLLSSMGPRGTAAEVKAKGFAAALTKPVRQSSLFNALTQALGGLRPGAPSPAPAAEGGALDLNVLAAEDNVVNQQVITLMLGKLGCRVEVVGTGRAALTALERATYDVVLMDVQMPEMDGFEAIAEIRRREMRSGGHQPVIAMTAHAMEGDRERCLAAGMDDYVSKPVKAKELKAALLRAKGVPAPVPAGDRAVTPKPYGREVLAENCGDAPEIILDILRSFLSSTSELLAEIAAALANGDAASLARQAHSLKGSCLAIGAEVAASVCAQLEQTARLGDVVTARALLPRAERELELLCATIDRDIAEGGSTK